MNNDLRHHHHLNATGILERRRNESAIIDFVTKVTTANCPAFVPPAKRIATFDNDGTLYEKDMAWPGKAAADYAKGDPSGVLTLVTGLAEVLEGVTAKRVLPQPPGHVNVSKRTDSNRRVMSAISRSRPMKRACGAGRLACDVINPLAWSVVQHSEVTRIVDGIFRVSRTA